MYDVIVIGGGPSGMIASIKASINNKVLLIEKNDELGKKLKLTGGGRCNLTNLKSIDYFLKEIPVNNKFLYSSLNKFGPKDIYDYFTNLGVPLKIEEDDKVFPMDNKSTSIIKVLNREMLLNNVDINYNEKVFSIINKDNYKEIVTDKNKYKTKSVVITTGGLSYSFTGSNGDGYKFAKELNQEVTNLYPAETYLITKELLSLAGITLDNVRINYNKKRIEGSLLFTHNGLSGPSIFKVSEFVYKDLIDNEYITLSIDMVPNYSDNELLNKLNEYDQKKEILNFLKEFLPKRLIEYIFKEIDINKKINSISKIDKQKIISMLKDFKLIIKDTGSIDNAFITGGGINIKYINPKTMESTIHKDIYFAGEILDVHGHTGGFNLTIAFSTGYVAGISCNNK